MPIYSLGLYEAVLTEASGDTTKDVYRIRFFVAPVPRVVLALVSLAILLFIFPGPLLHKKILPGRWLLIPLLLGAIALLCFPERYISWGFAHVAPSASSQLFSVAIVLWIVSKMKNRARVYAALVIVGVSYAAQFLTQHVPSCIGPLWFRVQVATGSSLWTIPVVLGFFAVRKKFSILRLALWIGLFSLATQGVTIALRHFVTKHVGYTTTMFHLLPIIFPVALVLFIRFSSYFRECISRVLGLSLESGSGE